MSIFKTVTGSKSEFSLLGEGYHKVTLEKYMETNSFLNADGSKKKELPEWADATPQLFIKVKNAEGSLGHRLNGLGYVKSDDLTDKEIESGEFIASSQYACKKDANGNLVRIQDEKYTEQAANIFANFLYATAGEGGDIQGLEDVVADNEEFVVKVVNKPYEGKDNFEIVGFYCLEDGMKIMEKTTATVEAGDLSM